MDDAPKSGERILLYGPDGVDIGHWEPHWFPGAWLRQETAEYDNDGAFISQPIRWMPLPPPPPTTGDKPVPISNIKDKTDGN